MMKVDKQIKQSRQIKLLYCCLLCLVCLTCFMVRHFTALGKMVTKNPIGLIGGFVRSPFGTPVIIVLPLHQGQKAQGPKGPAGSGRWLPRAPPAPPVLPETL